MFETIDGQHIADLLSDYAQAFILEEERLELEAATKVQKIKQKKLSFADSTVLNKTNKAVVNTNHTKNTHKYHTPIKSPVNNSKPERRKSKFNIFTAVVAIQALYRGYALRRDWIREDAAIFVQSVYRGHRARSRVSNIIEAMINA